MRRLLLTLLSLCCLAITFGQVPRSMDMLGGGGQRSAASSLRNSGRGNANDSTSTKGKEIPRGVKVWTVDSRFGEITAQPMDTVTHHFPNTIFTAGKFGEYNTLGGLGAPRISRIFANRNEDNTEFIFTQPYDYFTLKPADFLFTNTRSPYANLTYNFCGNRINGEDHFTAKYAVNAGKRLGFGFKINYLYGRGYYNDQNSSLLNGNVYASYLGDAYQAHFIWSTNAQKISENGGITDDMFITHPESFDDNFASTEIPTMLSRNWNRNRHSHIFLTHRYSVGFNRKVPMTEEEIEARRFALQAQKDAENQGGQPVNDNRKRNTQPEFKGRPANAAIAKEPVAIPDSLSTDSLDSGRMQLDMAAADSIMNAEKKNAEAQPDTAWIKNEFVPVTSFIHTLQFDTHDRIYQAYDSPSDYYAENFFAPEVIGADSIFDKTKHNRLRNTFAISMVEGFNKWAFAGIKLFATSDLRNYKLPDEDGHLQSHNTHNLSIGGQLSRTKGNTLHYNVTAETWLLGDDQAQLKIDGIADLNFPLFGDTVTLAAKASFHNERPNYYLRHFHGRHFWWDDDLSMSTRTHLEGLFTYKKTRTTLRFAADELTNYTYLVQTFQTDDSGMRVQHKVSVRQSAEAITVLTAALDQRLTFGPFNVEAIATWQKSTAQNILPVSAINLYANAFLRFRIAKVLYTELGADMRYFTEYEAPDYVPGLGQFAVQENQATTKIGNYPIIGAYANFNLKGTRFFIMYSHANCGSGNSNYFLTPHYPINPTVLRMGISWNFFN